MKDKKANSFYILIFTIFVVFIMFFMVFKLIDKYKEISNNKKLGERQAELLRVYQKAEKALLYADQSAKIASEQAIYDFAKNGGLKEKKCGSYKGYAVWDFEKGCIADEDFLKQYINENLNIHFSNYPDSVAIPLDNYNLIIRQDNGNMIVVGLANEPIKIEAKR